VNRAELDRMASVEDSMWWYQGLHRWLLDTLRRYSSMPIGLIVDAGCGSGGLLRYLDSSVGWATTCGVDIDASACALARGRTRAPIVQASVERLPFAPGTVDLMFSADVLCHQRVDPDRALGEAARCLRPGGVLVANLPAHPWLLSAHDARVDNARRFTRRQATRLFRKAGLSVRSAVHWNFILFPAMVAHRLWPGRHRADRASDTRPFGRFTERCGTAALAAERALCGVGLAPPFGGSILAVAQKR
jgi:SAM-dependent methyltransferase